MYVAIYEHGTLAMRKQSAMRCQEDYVRAVKACIEDERYTVTTVVPRYTMFVCDNAEHIARNRRDGVPCVAISYQAVMPEIPQGWPLA